jgi:hypothetical protein
MLDRGAPAREKKANHGNIRQNRRGHEQRDD